jgi:SAM-dependent methyltransferase
MGSRTLMVLAGGLTVPWTRVPMYNTIMGLAAGVGLLLLVWFGADLLRGRPVEFEGWALAFGIVGLIQFVTGLHMSLTWPIAFIAPWDNIYFGETCLAFGTLLLAAALYLWRRGDALAGLERDALLARLQRVLRPNGLFVFALGLALAWIGVFPLVYPVYAAPPQEPISGHFAGYPRLESTAFALLYFALALGCLLFPWAIRTLNRALLAIIALAWGVPGAGLVLFVAMNYFTHGGLTYNTR